MNLKTDKTLPAKHRISDDNLADNRVTTANDLIQASYSLTLNEQRLVLAAISKINSRTANHTPLKIKITALEFGETFQINSKHAYTELKEAANSLFERELRPANAKSRTRMRWVATYVDYHAGEGWAELTFNPDIVPFLTLLKEKFTSYQLGRAACLRRPTTIRLFQLLMQFERTGFFTIELDRFIKIFELSYDRFADVRRWVIEPAVAELKQKSNLEIIWKPIKEGRAVKHIEFHFRESPQRELELENSI